MAEPVSFSVEATYTNNTLKYLNKLLHDPMIRLEINKKIGNAINSHVPRDSGALQDSMQVYEDRITWGEGLSYARYQYNGEVYGPNRPITKNGVIIGWYSKPGAKHPTGRILGVPGTWRGWKFGYHTPGTTHHWINEYRGQLKANTNREITYFLKRECKARGLS